MICLICTTAVQAVFSEAAAAQNLRELARARAAEAPGGVLHIAAPPGDYAPANIVALAKASDLVLRGTLVLARSYLGSNEARVLTDYRIDVEQVFAGSTPAAAVGAPGVTAPRILTVFGGDVMLDGVSIRATDPNRREIMEGQSYFMFLRRSRAGQAGHYEIQNGGIFAVVDGATQPLLKQGHEVFGSLAGAPIGEVIQQLRTIRSAAP